MYKPPSNNTKKYALIYAGLSASVSVPTAVAISHVFNTAGQSPLESAGWIGLTGAGIGLLAFCLRSLWDNVAALRASSPPALPGPQPSAPPAKP